MFHRFLLICSLMLTPLISTAQTSGPPDPDPQKLGKPSIRGVNGSVVGWTQVTGATGYRLRWFKPNSTRTFKTVGASPPIFTLTNLDEGASYVVQVRALGDGVNYEKKGKWSARYSFTAPSSPAQGPLELSRPNLGVVSGTTVSWNAVTGATSYRVRWIAPDGATKGKGLSASTTSYTINKKKLKSGVTYNVQVRARGDGVNYEKKGPWSGSAQIQG